MGSMVPAACASVVSQAAFRPSCTTSGRGAAKKKWARASRGGAIKKFYEKKGDEGGWVGRRRRELNQLARERGMEMHCQIMVASDGITILRLD